MQVQQKSYAQIVIVNSEDFVFSSVYRQYESMCPFLCFPGLFAADFRASLKQAEAVVLDKDVILLLEPYWRLLQSHEKKAILDHELGHIASGHLKKIAEAVKNGTHKGGATVIEADEKEADAYSAEINGSQAMYSGLMKAVDVMVDGYKRQGYPVTIDKVLDHDPIIRNRLKLLKNAGKPDSNS